MFDLDDLSMRGDLPKGEKNLVKAYKDAGLLAAVTGGLFMGSFTVDMAGANDVDLVIPEDKWRNYNASAMVDSLNLVPYDPLEGSEEYDQAQAFDEIRELYRNADGLNVIVCNPYMWPAYVKATRIVNEHKLDYLTRAARVNLYIECKNAIHEMLGNEPRPLD